ncbi:hypothetical protein FOMPIDRAFT_1022429, partial [Fomitopsis schrenkii]
MHQGALSVVEVADSPRHAPSRASRPGNNMPRKKHGAWPRGLCSGQASRSRPPRYCILYEYASVDLVDYEGKRARGEIEGDCAWQHGLLPYDCQIYLRSGWDHGRSIDRTMHMLMTHAVRNPGMNISHPSAH